MAKRLNTVEYAFPQISATINGSIGPNISQPFSQITVEIPEVSGRTFVSAYADVFTMDAVVAAVSPTAFHFGIRCSSYGAGPFMNQTLTTTVANSGENMSFHLLYDVSSQFRNNFTTNASYVVDASFAIAVSTSNNTSCKLVLTYEYEDSVATTRVKTVRIPLESSTGPLSASALGRIRGGGNDIPALDSFLPEASKAYKDIFFETWVNTSCTAANVPDISLGFALDAEAVSYDTAHPDTLASARLYRRIWQRKDMNTATEHYFNARGGTGSLYYHLGSLLNVTYTYDEESTTRVMNSLMLAGADELGYNTGTTVADTLRFQRALSIPDENPVLQRSGLLCSYIDSGAVTTNIAVGSQSFTAYANVATVVCGGFMFYHNFDGSSRKGQGITLSKNGEYTIDFYSSSATVGSTGTNFSALMYLNYTADKSTLPGGSSNNPHTIIPWMNNLPATAAILTTVTRQPIDIPEYNRWIMGLVPVISTAGGAVSPFFMYYTAERDSSSDPSIGWSELYSGTGIMDSEYAPTINFARARKEFRRWPYDTDKARLYLEKSRSFRFGQSAAATRFASYWPITYHTIINNANGTISGYTGDGSGISIIAYDDTFLKENIYEGSTNIGGGFGFPWYNSSINVIVDAYQDATHKGLYIGPINASLNINFGSTGGGATSWVF